MNDQLLDAWAIHNRILLYLLDALPPEALRGLPEGGKGRNVGEMFGHINRARLMWLETAGPKLMAEVINIPMKTKADKETITKEKLRGALEKSGAAIGKLLHQGLEKGKLTGLKPHLMAGYSYFIAHEWYHVGEICMTLTQAGHKLDDQVLYGMWEWGKH